MMTEHFDDQNIDDFEIESRLFFSIHGGPSIGSVVMSSVNDDYIGEQGITFDHGQIGDTMRSDGVFGIDVMETLLGEGLDDEQIAIRDLLEKARRNPDIDLL